MNEDVMLRADEKKINWYPGHMARAKRALADQLSRVDVVVELCDARIPRASRNPDLADMIKNKRHLLVLGKADLAEERETRAWLGYFRAQGIDCMSFDSIRGKAKDIVARIEKASAEMCIRDRPKADAWRRTANRLYLRRLEGRREDVPRGRNDHRHGGQDAHGCLGYPVVHGYIRCV